MNIRHTILSLLIALFAIGELSAAECSKEQPRIVNIINFIRLLEPRDPVNISEDVLFDAVRQEADMLKEYQLPGTFLIQYDALIVPRYQQLLKEGLYEGSEVGAWWEITQPHVEAAGLKWRGRYPWDWHAHVGFSTGYTPEERELLVDIYMAKFKEIFGVYPRSVGAWYIDAHTLQYMHSRYGIVASCNCRDQYGTDGYTMWGGYWNQGYYPSRHNAYMPAQSAAEQIDVPIFRMLGSDPVYQYDTGVGGVQNVITLEPACHGVGDNPKWVDWYFKTMFTQPCLDYNYVHVGQENSFTWDRIRGGYQVQIPRIADYRKQGVVRVETLGQSGEWFRKNYRVTPPTAVTAMEDYNGNPIRSVWYNSRFYRTNMMWVHDMFRFRDIHLFDERIASDYLTTPGTSNKCTFMTMPLVDGFLWSTHQQWAGVRVVELGEDGSSREIALGEPTIEERGKELIISCHPEQGEFTIRLSEQHIDVDFNTTTAWALELSVANGKQMPFKSFTPKSVSAEFNNHPYTLQLKQGEFREVSHESIKMRILPAKRSIILDCNLLK